MEVVINQLKPYPLKNKSTHLTLEPDLKVDMEEEKFAKLGLRDIWMFNVDSQGNIYLWDLPLTTADLVYKLDPAGNFVKSFLRRGEGPGEVQSPNSVILTPDDEILISDFFPQKLVYLDLFGTLIKETKLDSRIGGLQILNNGNYSILKTRRSSNSDFRESLRTVCDKSFQVKRILSSRKIQDFRTADKINGTTADESFLLHAVSDKRIYLGDNEKENYEILSFDHEGNLIRKIRKAYTPVKVSEKFKEETLSPYKKSGNAMLRSIKNKLYFPKHMPPYQSLFCDDEGHLFVMTYEEGENSGEYIWDIFSDEGIFIGRAGIGNFEIWERRNPGQLKIIAKNRYLYFILLKESGFKVLVRYKMKWS